MSFTCFQKMIPEWLMYVFICLNSVLKLSRCNFIFVIGLFLDDFCSLDVVSHQTPVILSIRVLLCGISHKMQLIATLTVMLGVMIQMFCASIANLARLDYCRALRLSGRLWLLSTSYSWSSWLLCCPSFVVQSGVSEGTIGRDIITKFTIINMHMS